MLSLSLFFSLCDIFFLKGYTKKKKYLPKNFLQKNITM